MTREEYMITTGKSISEDIAEVIILDEMPYDHEFYYCRDSDGVETREYCHATGIMIRFTDNSAWWNEYKDSEGGLHYGR